MPRTPTVLLLTFAADHYTVDRVAAGLARRGARPVRVDTDRFPAELALVQRLGAADSGALRVGAEWIPAEAITAAWLRHLVSPAPPAGLSEADARQVVLEAGTALGAWLAQLAAQGTRFVDDPRTALAVAADKPAQLRAAAAAGLAIPETLVTNDPDAARRFIAELEVRGDAAIAKLQTSAIFGLEGRRGAAHVRRLRADDVAALDALRLCPMMFQPLVPKRRELRVTWVDGRCFAGAITSTADDWRDPRGASTGFTRAELPASIVAALGRLMARLGLRFGALDLIETPAGEHVFLEVNPCGEWGMLERDLDLPIADALAGALLEPA